MSDIIRSETVGNYEVRVVVDPDPTNPRHDDNLGKMTLFTLKTHLGDYHDINHRQYNGWDDIEALLRKDGAVVMLPVYGYNHSGWSVSTKVEPYWFHYSWDGGKLGYIYTTRARIKEFYGWTKLTPARLECITAALESEVAVYNQYLCGEVYGHRVVDRDTGVVEDDCYGYYTVEEALRDGVEWARGH